MGIEILVRSEHLARVVARGAARELRHRCPPTSPGAWIDRLDVDEPGATVRASVGSVEILVPVDVVHVPDATLRAGANDPSPSMFTTTRVTLVLALRAVVRAQSGNAARTVVGAEVKDALGLPPEPWGAMVKKALSPLADVTESDLTGLFDDLSIGRPTATASEVVEGVVAFRFDPDANASGTLAPGQQAGIFISGPTWEEIVRARLGGLVQQLGPRVQLAVTWAPRGGVPHLEVVAKARETFDVLGVLVPVEIWAEIELDVALRPGGGALRVSGAWSPHFRVGPGVGVVESLVEDEIGEVLDGLVDPASFGAVPTGHRRFVLDLDLPVPQFAGARHRIDDVAATRAGTVMHGVLVLPALNTTPFAMEVSPLGGPVRIQLCSVLAKAGSGSPDRRPLTLAKATSFGHIRLGGVGHWCELRVVEPVAFDPHVREVVSSDGESVDIWASIPYSTALAHPRPLRVLVRTARGVRYADLGVAPPVVVDEDGVVRSPVVDDSIDDCLKIVPGSRGGIGWGDDLLGEGERVDVDRFKPPPLEDPGWARFVEIGSTLSTQVITLDALEPGELVRFRSDSHAIDVTADREGRAVVPVILRSEPGAAAQARLERVTRRSVEGHVHVRTAAFLLHGAGGVDVALNPQPLPPIDDGSLERIGLRDVVDVLPLPGFDDVPVAVAVLADGGMVVVELGDDPRVSGTFRGPLGRL